MKEIVIKIPDHVYEHMIETGFVDLEANQMGCAIRNGKVLPKGHGRLIDADDIDNHIIGHVDTRSCPTIIGADEDENE